MRSFRTHAASVLLLVAGVLVAPGPSCVPAQTSKPAEPAAPTPRTKPLNPLLPVVRLAPGEARTLEFDLPGGGFRPQGRAGRQTITVALKTASGFARPVRAENFDKVDGLAVVWEKEQPAVTFRAAEGAKAGTSDLRLQYEDYMAIHPPDVWFIDVRVVITPKDR